MKNFNSISTYSWKNSFVNKYKKQMCYKENTGPVEACPPLFGVPKRKNGNKEKKKEFQSKYY